jgi:hypothetical protein
LRKSRLFWLEMGGQERGAVNAVIMSNLSVNILCRLGIKFDGSIW